MNFINMKERIGLILLVFALLPSECNGFIEGLYCGVDNCYDVLGVTRESTRSEITKAYRNLARKYHPDVHRGEEAKLQAEANFTKIATAYEVLKDEESRRDYDYMLDNPESVYQHYYRYYRRRVAPKVDVRIVIGVTITVISIVQYFSSWQKYNSAISYFITVPKYRLKAMDLARQNGYIEVNSKKKGKKSKEELREEEEKALRRVLEENMDIRGGYAKPSIWDILWVQIVVLPYTIVMWIVWYARWFWKFTICKEEYGEEEKIYLIRKNLGISQGQYDVMSPSEKEDFMIEELWIKENFKEWKEEKEEENKRKLADSARYKSYRRYIKQHGHGTITFED